ncbi:unnamed protein product [Acanthoscelides obtectus]|uniref:Uncharacterized protein n=1 Tax=Acanthoscelides obtectus TaxID=200917 RepID=A0A9P0PU14_ACAOB|nr:unnamed protein product [Acanthoscelides obtectus]CAK1656338.1 hypothetical protein AOBTE_LOCUS19653 [Acanthoscelides obtectus]
MRLCYLPQYQKKMSPKKKPKLSKEEIASKKSAAAKARLEKIKSDPVLLAEYKEKERVKYLRKKEKGQRKSIQDMTPREQRNIRKQWKKYSTNYRKKKTIRKDCENYVVQNTPPTSENESSEENVDPEPQINNNNNENSRQVEAKRRSRYQRKIRNKVLQEKCAIIDDLKKKLNTQQKKYNRLKQKIEKSKKLLTPKSKIEQMAEDPNQSRELVKKALFGEVLQAQITENISKVQTHQEKSNFKQLLAGPTVEKYKLWRQSCSSILYNKIRRKSFKNKDKTKKNLVVQMVHRFYEDDTIWAHLQPVLASLPLTVENLHFLSDGPVTQYRNKAMFFILACKLVDFHPNVMTFSWNYLEAGHGKGAPDGVGATCKRTAQKANITNVCTFAATLRENCPGIKISVIEDSDIDTVHKLIRENENNLQAFKGTLLVHQVTGHAYFPNKLIMKSLSCFCSPTCNHHKLGILEYTNQSKHLKVVEVYSTDSEEYIPLQKQRKSGTIEQAGISMNLKDKMKVTYYSGDYVLIKFMVNKKEYRYAAICSYYDDEEGELTVTFLKVCNKEGNLFKLDEGDVADILYEDVIEKLSMPCLIVKGRQNIPLRWHRDRGRLFSNDSTNDEDIFNNEGNFRELIRFRVESGDNLLKKNLENSKAHARY